MNVKSLGGGIIILMAWHLPALAQSTVEERLSKMERRLQYLEHRVATQDKVIVAKDKEIAHLKKQGEKTESGWFSKVEVHGAVEVEGSYSDPYTGGSTSDIALATAAIGLQAQVHDWVGAEVSLLYEEDDTPLELDTGSITLAPPNGPWSLQAGQIYVPFGVFETNMVSDPLTLELAETRETAVKAGFAAGGFSGAVFVFNGTSKQRGDNDIDDYGATLGYAMEKGDAGFAVNFGYISDIGDSDTVQDVVASNLGSNDVMDNVPAWTASVVAGYRGFTVIGEYVAALDNFQMAEVPWRTGGAQPKAWGVEGGYAFNLFGKEATVAVGYQETREALALELPRSRFLTAFSVEVYEMVSLSLEWAHDKDYGVADGGTGKSADTVTTQLAVEF